MRREERAKKYIPMPPGITCWKKVRVIPNVETEIWRPVTRPLARCETDLTDEEVLGLIADLNLIARRRGLTVDWSRTRSLSGVMDYTGSEPTGAKLDALRQLIEWAPPAKRNRPGGL